MCQRVISERRERERHKSTCDGDVRSSINIDILAGSNWHSVPNWSRTLVSARTHCFGNRAMVGAWPKTDPVDTYTKPPMRRTRAGGGMWRTMTWIKRANWYARLRHLAEGVKTVGSRLGALAHPREPPSQLPHPLSFPPFCVRAVNRTSQISESGSTILITHERTAKIRNFVISDG